MNQRYIEMYEYNLWACEQTSESMATVPSDASAADKSEHRSLAVFAHMASAGLIWLMRLNRKGSVDLPIWPDWVLEEAQENALSGCHQLLEFARNPPKNGLDEKIEYTNSSGGEFVNTAAEILDHVNLHYHYHRGQIAMLVKQEGGTPAATDYIFYKRK